MTFRTERIFDEPHERNFEPLTVLDRRIPLVVSFVEPLGRLERAAVVECWRAASFFLEVAFSVQKATAKLLNDARMLCWPPTGQAPDHETGVYKEGTLV